MATIGRPLDVLSLPYARRQLVIVQPDQVVAAAREAEANATTKSGDTDWDEAVRRIKSTILGFPPYGGGKLLTEVVLEVWAKVRENGLDVLRIGHSETLGLQFPPGHPRELTMYVAHPAVPTVYYTAASFHRMAFEHKFSEAVKLLMSLGASRIVVEHVHGWSKEFAATVSAGLPKGEAGVSWDVNSSGSSKILFDATLKNKNAPVLPNDLVWYPHEPTWQIVAAGRLEYGMEQFSLNVVYENDFGINAGLNGKAKKAGLELGGSFEDHKSTTWKIHGTFAGYGG